MGKIVRGYWDCQYCGATGIPGDKRECTACGHPRDESVTFYMKEVEYLSDEEAANVSKNADWYCPYCNTLNSDKDVTCKGCGAAREESEKDYFDLQKEKNAPKEEFVPIQNEKPKRFSLWPFIILGALLLLAFLFFRPKTKDAVIDSFSWSRNIEIEKYQQFKETAWEGESIPNDAEIYDKRIEQHPTEKEIIGYQDVEVTKYRNEIVGYENKYKDLGNGNFEEYQEPVYGDVEYTEIESQPIYVPVEKTRYYYTVWRWARARDALASEDDHNPYWPELNLASDEREGIRSGKYSITVTEKKKTATYTMDEYYENVWNALKKGDKVIIRSQAGNKELYDSNENFLARIR